MIGEPQNAKALRRQPCVARGVMLGFVKRAVCFDDEPMPEANEVEHVGAYRNLAPELKVAKPAVA